MTRELRPGDVRPDDFGKDGQLTPEAKRRLGLMEERNPREAPKPPAREVDHAAVIREAFAEETLHALEALRREDVAEFVAQYNKWKAKLREAKVSLVQWESARAKIARSYQREHPRDLPLAVPVASVCPVVLAYYLQASIVTMPWDRMRGLEPLVPFMAHTRSQEALTARTAHLSTDILEQCFSALVSGGYVQKRSPLLRTPKNASERRDLLRWLQTFDDSGCRDVVGLAFDALYDLDTVLARKDSAERIAERIAADSVQALLLAMDGGDLPTDGRDELFGPRLLMLLKITGAAEKRSR